MKRMEGLVPRHLPKKETVLADQGLSSKEPIRSIAWLEITYIEAEGQRKEPLFCALEPDGINLLPIRTSEDPYRINSKRMKGLSA